MNWLGLGFQMRKSGSKKQHGMDQNSIYPELRSTLPHFAPKGKRDLLPDSTLDRSGGLQVSSKGLFPCRFGSRTHHEAIALPNSVCCCDPMASDAADFYVAIGCYIDAGAGISFAFF